MLPNKVIEENKDLQAAQQRLQEKQMKEREEHIRRIQSMPRHQRRAFAKANGWDKIPGINTDHIKK